MWWDQYAKTCSENKIEIGNYITENTTYDSVSVSRSISLLKCQIFDLFYDMARLVQVLKCKVEQTPPKLDINK